MVAGCVLSDSRGSCNATMFSGLELNLSFVLCCGTTLRAHEHFP